MISAHFHHVYEKIRLGTPPKEAILQACKLIHPGLISSTLALMAYKNGG